MAKRLIQSLQEAVAYAKGDKTKGHATKIRVSQCNNKKQANELKIAYMRLKEVKNG